MIKRLFLIGLLTFSLVGHCFADGNDSNTVSLLHMDGADASTTFTDNAAGGTHTWTANGNAQIDTAVVKFGTGSGLFDGDGDYISTPDSNDWYFGTGNFTVDFWVNFNDLKFTQTTSFTGQTLDGDNNWIFQKYNSNPGSGQNKLRFVVFSGATYICDYQMTNAWSGVATGTWYHLALVRSGTSILMFIDGVSQALDVGQAIGTQDVGDIAAVLNVGYGGSGTIYWLNGAIDEFRISKGIARWTANFTPPTEAYSEVARRIVMIQ